tara:strand:- start:66507 stop:67055 length:549 start_codon:yes stop_codon:yes gene_type:complete
MELLQSIRTEYTRYRRLAELSLEQVADADLDRRIEGDSQGNSIAVTMGHLIGNLKSRFTDFLTTDGEKEWRQRDREFESPNLDRAGLMTGWHEAWEIVDRALDDVANAGDAVFAKNITIRNVPLTVTDALLRSVAHVAYHTGQIVYLARTFVGPGWQSPSIPKGQSDAYAKNPTREKRPDGK